MLAQWEHGHSARWRPDGRAAAPPAAAGQWELRRESHNGGGGQTQVWQWISDASLAKAFRNRTPRIQDRRRQATPAREQSLFMQCISVAGVYHLPFSEYRSCSIEIIHFAPFSTNRRKATPVLCFICDSFPQRRDAAATIRLVARLSLFSVDLCGSLNWTKTLLHSLGCHQSACELRSLPTDY